jgi:tetratricopeptide (TPR) repeat protein
MLMTDTSLLPAASPVSSQRQKYGTFEKLMKADDFEAAEKHLQQWQQQSRDDAELAVAQANYLARQAELPMQINRSAGAEAPAPSPGSYRLTKPGTTETVGFIETQPHYDDATLTRAITILKDALTTYPQRADIWMGATHLHLLGNDYAGAFRILTDFTAYAKQHADALRWRYNGPLDEKATEFMPKKLHAYAVRGFDAGTTEGREFLLKVARLAQGHYPEHPYAYNDEAAYYNALEQDDKVLDCLQRALKVRPKDALVMINIGATYKNMKNWDKAREYFERAIKTTDDEEMRSAAKEELSALKKRQ